VVYLFIKIFGYVKYFVILLRAYNIHKETLKYLFNTIIYHTQISSLEPPGGAKSGQGISNYHLTNFKYLKINFNIYLQKIKIMFAYMEYISYI